MNEAHTFSDKLFQKGKRQDIYEAAAVAKYYRANFSRVTKKPWLQGGGKLKVIFLTISRFRTDHSICWSICLQSDRWVWNSEES